MGFTKVEEIDVKAVLEGETNPNEAKKIWLQAGSEAIAEVQEVVAEG